MSLAFPSTSFSDHLCSSFLAHTVPLSPFFAGMACLCNAQVGLGCALFKASVDFAYESHEFAANAALLLSPATLVPITQCMANAFYLFINKLISLFSGEDSFKENAVFILDIVLHHAIQIFEQRHGGKMANLQKLSEQLHDKWHKTVHDEVSII
eukprot:m.21818 g.21818  ORF g.21818 m.21818 type:complete len:154 (+) comp8336_c0_seq1:157-618(+)